MNNQIIFLLLLVGVFLNVIPPLTTATAAQDNPFSFHWWYKQHKVYDTTHDDEDKKHSKKHSKQSSSQEEERLDKKFCANSGKWNGKKCIIEDPVEKAAYEDAVCDEPKDSAKYSVCGGGSNDNDDKPSTSIVSVKPVVVEKPTIDPPGYVESKFTQDIADDDPTTAEYKEKIIKFESERSPEESKQAEEHSFCDDNFDRSNDGHTSSNDDDNDDKNKDDNDKKSNDDDSNDDNDDNDGGSDGDSDSGDNDKSSSE